MASFAGKGGERTENGINNMIGMFEGGRKIIRERDFEVFELSSQSLKEANSSMCVL